MKPKLKTPKNQYIAVIGDIHGCYYTLKALYTKLGKFKDNIYTVGDIIDRGNHSKETVQFIIDKKIKPVIGNHEHWYLDAINKRECYYYIRKWMSYHGDTTVESYLEMDSNATFEDFHDAVMSCGHNQFISTFPLKYEINNVIISHAGIISGGDDVSIFFNSETPLKLPGKLQIFGHTPYTNIQHIKNWFANIDTGCVFQNKLTAVIVDTLKGEIVEVMESDFVD